MPTISKFGRNSTVDNNTEEDVWEIGGDYVYQSANAGVFVSSSDGGDTAELTIEGLIEDGDDWVLQEKTVTLAGQTKTAVDGTWIRIFRAYTTSGADLTGQVYIYEDDTVTAGVPDNASGEVKATIMASRNQSEMALWTVPSVWNGTRSAYWIWNWTMGLSNTSGAAAERESDFSLLVRPYGGSFAIKGLYSCVKKGQSAGQVYYQLPFPSDAGLAAKTDVKVRAKVTGGASDVFSTFQAYSGPPQNTGQAF